MTKKMLIDATHAEETRVAIVDGKQLVEFDYESKVRKQIKGGIYLAKVTRVEPSLQAAFVNFGGNRHGFLPFSEIHPDYFRIPVSDREALIAEQQAELEKLDAVEDEEEEAVEETAESDVDEDTDDTDDDDADDDEDVVEVGGADKPADDEDADLVAKEAKQAAKKEAKSKKPEKKKIVSKKKKDAPEETDEENIGNVKQDDAEISDEELDAQALEKAQALENADENSTANNKGRRGRGRYRGRGRQNNQKKNKRANMRRGKSDEVVGGDGNSSDKPFRFNLRHKYKIQEVVKRGQIMLIQVSKEERGNKGAAVTTYISLPGRYCVLMPNSPRGGGVSRKIGNFKDRKRMREILKELTIPDGMSVILRTAGVSRTKAEIKRDLDYLTRLWNTIREETLQSTAPALINEEGNLIKRSIRDLYTRDIDDVLVSGEKAYKVAKNFMKMLVPSHAKKVKEYKDDKIPLFHKYNVEKQISEIGEITVTLKSGGYLVINPTEALVSVDVNSGKATKERHIEETALKTNMEAAGEVARQLRLRDLGGLVVIDFIDMEERRNNRKVENKLRDALSSDRARIQVGRISSFGLLELSRQRLNPSLTEAQFEKCPHCDGVGMVKTLDFAVITAMRSLEEEGIQGKVKELSLNVPNNVAVYILNNKRQMLADIEKRYDFRVHIRVDDSLKASEFRIDTIAQHEGKKSAPVKAADSDAVDEGSEKQRKGRRRGRRGGRRRHQNRTEEDNTSQENQKENASDDKPAKKEAEKSKDDNKDDKKPPAKKSPKKAESKKSDSKKDKDKSPVQAQEPSNDVKAPKAEAVKDYEVVNEAPKKKKKGWWNQLVD